MSSYLLRLVEVVTELCIVCLAGQRGDRRDELVQGHGQLRGELLLCVSVIMLGGHAGKWCKCILIYYTDQVRTRLEI